MCGMDALDRFPRPHGPHDPFPGVSIRLTRFQLERVAVISREHEHGVRLRDRGATWVEATLLDGEGAEVDRVILPPG